MVRFVLLEVLLQHCCALLGFKSYELKPEWTALEEEGQTIRKPAASLDFYVIHSLRFSTIPPLLLNRLTVASTTKGHYWLVPYLEIGKAIIDET